jgi:type I restriction enzyme S subunit
MRLRHVATMSPPVGGFARSDAGAAVSFLPLDRIWADERFDPSEAVEFEGDVRSYNPVAEGDLLLPKVSPTFAHGRTAIATGLTGGRALATSEVFVLRARDPRDTRFLQYRLRSPDFLAAGQAAWQGVAGLKRVSAGFVKDTPIDPAAWARRHELAVILDGESARIAACLDAEQRLQDTALAGYRTWAAEALLDGSSGTTERLKHLVERPVGGAWGGEAGTDEVDVWCARVADFDREALVVRAAETVRSVGARDACRLALRDGDLLMERSGGGAKSPVGFVVRYAPEGPEAAATVSSNFVARLRPRAGCEPVYLAHLFAALYAVRRTEPFVKQNTGIQNLDVEGYLSLRVPSRTLEQQRALGREAEERLAASLRLREGARRLRCALQAYRESLIFEAVSGRLGRGDCEARLEERALAAAERREAVAA